MGGTAKLICLPVVASGSSKDRAIRLVSLAVPYVTCSVRDVAQSFTAVIPVLGATSRWSQTDEEGAKRGDARVPSSPGGVSSTTDVSMKETLHGLRVCHGNNVEPFLPACNPATTSCRNRSLEVEHQHSTITTQSLLHGNVALCQLEPTPPLI